MRDQDNGLVSGPADLAEFTHAVQAVQRGLGPSKVNGFRRCLVVIWRLGLTWVW
jgi:hypothetical protein